MSYTFKCPTCKKECEYTSKTVFTTLINTGTEFDFCSQECLDVRMNELRRGDYESLFPSYHPKYNFIIRKIENNPSVYEIEIPEEYII